MYIRRIMNKKATATTPSQRLAVILKISGYNSVQELAHAIGLKETKHLSLISGGKMAFSANIAKSLHRLFPIFTENWIVSGEHLLTEHIYTNRNQMLIIDYKVKEIWIYNHLNVPYNVGQQPESVLCYPMKLCKDAAFGYQYPYYDLEPYCHNGDILLMKYATVPIKTEGLYYIEDDERKLFRYLRPIPKSHRFTALRFNDGTDTEILENMESGIVYQVCGVITAPCKFPLEPFVP